jgi:hypothetical protein
VAAAHHLRRRARFALAAIRRKRHCSGTDARHLADTFFARPDPLAHVGLLLGLRRREAWTFGALVVALVGFGMVPRPLVDSRFEASQQILRLRMLDEPSAGRDARPRAADRIVRAGLTPFEVARRRK